MQEKDVLCVVLNNQTGSLCRAIILLSKLTWANPSLRGREGKRTRKRKPNRQTWKLPKDCCWASPCSNKEDNGEVRTTSWSTLWLFNCLTHSFTSCPVRQCLCNIHTRTRFTTCPSFSPLPSCRCLQIKFQVSWALFSLSRRHLTNTQFNVRCLSSVWLSNN